MDFVDRTGRLKLDKDVNLRIEFGTASRDREVLLLRSNIYSDDKESRLSLSVSFEKKVFLVVGSSSV